VMMNFEAEGKRMKDRVEYDTTKIEDQEASIHTQSSLIII
jgi:hypothetical protein